MLVGYARVSTIEQNTSLQLDALRRSGVRRVYEDLGSGVGPRPQLQAAVGRLREGDTLVVWKLDRIARSLPDLLGVVERVQGVGAGIRSLTEHVDTATPIGQFTLQVLGAVAQLERNMILERTTAGLAAARARGVRLGRARVLKARDENTLVQLYASGSHTMADLADRYGVSLSVVKRAIYRVYKPGHSSLK